MDKEVYVFGKTLAKLRKKKGFTQEQLACKACVSKSFLASIERGNINVSLRIQLNIAKALEMPLSEIFELVEKRCRVIENMKKNIE